MRPRAARLPGIKDSGVAAESLHFSSKLSKWLDEDGLLRRGQDTNWKRQYKTRHNWAKGSCGVSELPIADEPSVPPILVQMHQSTVYMADFEHGLRAWIGPSSHKLLATASLHDSTSHPHTSPPSALAIDSSPSDTVTTNVALGFQDGSFALYQLDLQTACFTHRYTHEPSSNGMLSAVALSFPYFASMTDSQLLSLYKFAPPPPATSSQHHLLASPPLLQSLHSRTVWPPMTLSIRPSTDTVLVSIAYALPTYLSGWTVGIQEMRLTPSGELKHSRLASAIDQQYRPLRSPRATASSPNSSPLSAAPGGSSPPYGTSYIYAKPTSLSYTHPYLLVSHPDNTLTLYLVSSTAASLSISPGNRLWGHTSSVSGAQIAGRGKAVSVSRRGDELRVWELEGGFASSAARRRLATGELSVQLRPDTGAADTCAITTAGAARARGSRHACLDHYANETSTTRGWVGFDDERVVVLKEKSCGGQALVVYDFT